MFLNFVGFRHALRKEFTTHTRKPTGTRTLHIAVNDKNLFPHLLKINGEMDSDRRFPHPAFAVCRGDNHGRLLANSSVGG
jgi:hypothetical protein